MTHAPTIFDHLIEPRIVFAIDTSGSMHTKLAAMSHELLQFLKRRAHSHAVTFFNIFTFGSDTQSWSQQLTECRSDAVADAGRWLSDVGCRGDAGAAREALGRALADCSSDAVCLVTDGIFVVDEIGHERRSTLALAARRRLPVHCLLVRDHATPAAALDFLKELVAVSGGSLAVASISTCGFVQRISASVQPARGSADWQQRYGHCSVTASLAGDPLLLPPYRPVALLGGCCPLTVAKFRLAGSYGQAAELRLRRREEEEEEARRRNGTLAATAIVGRSVLARWDRDGCFYEGRVVEETDRGQFRVQLATGDADFSSATYQTVPIGDIVSLDDARRHALLPGDCALAPTGSGGRYQAAKILAGHERRDCAGASVDQPLEVSFVDGSSRTAEPGAAVWLPSEFYHRLELEAKLPPAARVRLKSSSSEYPERSRSGYCVSGPRRWPKELTAVRPGQLLDAACCCGGCRCCRCDAEASPASANVDDDAADARAAALIAEFEAKLPAGDESESDGEENVQLDEASATAPEQQRHRQRRRQRQTRAAWRPTSVRFADASQSAAMSRRLAASRSANAYDRRPPEIASQLGVGDVENEMRRLRSDAARRSESAERQRRLLQRREEETAAAASRLLRQRGRSEQQRRADADRDAGFDKLAEARALRRAAERQMRLQAESELRQRQQQAADGADLRRRVAADALRSSQAERRVVEERRGVSQCGGAVAFAREFAPQEPTVANWIKQQDAMNAEQTRSSAQQLAERHSSCHSALERQRLSQSQRASVVT